MGTSGPGARLRAGARGCLVGVAATLLLLLLLLLLYLLRGPILGAVGGWFTVEDPPARADLIYVLNGDGPSMTRPEMAADLYLRGLAPRVVIARAADPPARLHGLYPNDTDVNLGVLRQRGVPDTSLEQIVWHDGVTSTRDEALALRDYLERRPAERVLVVTTAYHTRRARWLVRRALRGRDVEIRMIPAPHPDFDERTWWHQEEGLLLYFAEVVKLVHNALAG